MAAANTISGINVNLTLQTAAFLRGIQQATQATAQGTAQIQRNLNQMNASFMQVGRQVTQFANGFKSLFAAQQILAGAKALADYSDAWQQVTNQIRASESISGNASEGIEKVFQIAQRTRVPIADLGDLYAKMVRVSGVLGASQQEVARATEITAQAFKAGGASTQEQVNGIRQLIQALGSGILQGDELRSIRENAPLLAQAIADEFGTTIAGLKQLGAEGQLVSDRVFKAILSAQDGIGAAFARTNATIGESFTILENAFIRLVGITGQESGLVKSITGSVIFLAENLSKVGDELQSNFLVIGLSRIGSTFDFFKRALKEAYSNLPTFTKAVGDASYQLHESTQNVFAYATNMQNLAVQLKEATDAQSLFNMANADQRLNAPNGPDMPLEEIARRAVEMEKARQQAAKSAAEDAMKDWETTVSTTEHGDKLLSAFERLPNLINATKDPLSQYQKNIADIATLEGSLAITQAQAADARLRTTATFASSTFDLLGQLSGAATGLFKENKAIAIADAVINTAAAIAKTIGTYGATPWGLAAAAVAAAVGAAQIATILSTNPGSSGKAPSVKGKGGSKGSSDAGKASTSSSSGSKSAGAAQLKQQVTLIIEGDSFGPEHFKKMVTGLNAVIADGAVLRVGGR